jgi:hypothetical protein
LGADRQAGFIGRGTKGFGDIHPDQRRFRHLTQGSRGRKLLRLGHAGTGEQGRAKNKCIEMTHKILDLLDNILPT